MDAPGSRHSRSGNNAMLFVCDAAGRVQATSSATSARMRRDDAGESDLAQFLGQDSIVIQWFLERIQEASDSADYSAEANLDLEDGARHVFVRLDRLDCDNECYRFALQLCPTDPGPELPLQKLEDGDSIVTRKEWHEIKNHIGALRLYATFLKRRMPEGDEREIVDKVLQGVNALIGYLDRIRRGGPQ